MKKNTEITKFEDFVFGIYDIKYTSLSGKTIWHVISHLYEFQNGEAMFRDVGAVDGNYNWTDTWSVDYEDYENTSEYYNFIYIGNKKTNPEYLI